MISYDMPFEKFGFGGFILNNSAGVGGFNSFTFNVSAAYEITQDPKLFNHLSVGLQLGFINKSFNPSNYLFDNQYSTENGGGFDNSLPIGETFEKTSVWIPESSMGIYYYNSNNTEMITGFGGISLIHLTAPKEDFITTLDDDNNLPRKLIVHGGAKYKMNSDLLLKPMLLYMRQKNVTEINLGVLGYYDLSSVYQLPANKSKSKIILIFGASYRYMDAAILQMGIFYSDFEYRFSYDINTSELSEISQGKGGFELSIMYKKPLTRRRPSIEIF
jgi:type IX secretion system PorP/SprF family membrane protein